jgi:polysaccharide deacetylase family protein (PEP-CTERM system associated)
MPTITNALTVDVEDYFQVSAFEPYISRGEWDRRECHVERNVERVLDLLEEHGAAATFFTLGWVAERYPRMVRGIVSRGHEIASHGYAHERATDMTPDEFSEDVVRAKGLLEDITGERITGYRAPSFSITADSLWAFDRLAKAGYRYSSSVYPVHHDHYGMPEAPRFAHTVGGGLLEVPPTTSRVWNRNLPSSGGGYFRLLPYAMSRWMLRRVNEVDVEPAVFYFHPWEIDTAQPRVQGIDGKTRFRHYVNIDRMQSRLGRLLDDFTWDRMDRIFLKEAG